MKPNIKFPFVLATHEEAEAFLHLVAGHFFAEYMEVTGQQPASANADALGTAMRRALEGQPDPMED